MTEQTEQSERSDEYPDETHVAMRDTPLVLDGDFLPGELELPSVEWDIQLGSPEWEDGGFRLPKKIVFHGRISKLYVNTIERAKDNDEAIEVLSPIELSDLRIRTLDVEEDGPRRNPYVYAELSES